MQIPSRAASVLRIPPTWRSFTWLGLARVLVALPALSILVLTLVSAFSFQEYALANLDYADLFTPLRRRIQAFIDRRFYRQKFNSGQALAQFVATARQETDLGQPSLNLTKTVQDTLQPEIMSLWLRPSADPTGRKEP